MLVFISRYILDCIVMHSPVFAWMHLNVPHNTPFWQNTKQRVDIDHRSESHPLLPHLTLFIHLCWGYSVWGLRRYSPKRSKEEFPAGAVRIHWSADKDLMSRNCWSGRTQRIGIKVYAWDDVGHHASCRGWSNWSKLLARDCERFNTSHLLNITFLGMRCSSGAWSSIIQPWITCTDHRYHKGIWIRSSECFTSKCCPLQSVLRDTLLGYAPLIWRAFLCYAMRTLSYIWGTRKSILGLTPLLQLLSSLSWLAGRRCGWEVEVVINIKHRPSDWMARAALSVLATEGSPGHTWVNLGPYLNIVKDKSMHNESWN